MKTCGVMAICVCCLGLGLLAEAQAKSPAPNAATKETKVAEHAKGGFEVKVIPQATQDNDDPEPGQASIGQTVSRRP
jgi:hypothetical protein